MDITFDEYWHEAEPSVKALIRTRVKDSHLREDVQQNVHIRCSLGFSTWRRDASFKTWALTITNRECTRALRQYSPDPLDPAEFSKFDNSIADEVPDVAEEPGKRLRLLVRAIGTAVADEDLSENEGRVIEARLTTGAEWKAIAQQLGIKASTCPVYHMRGIRTFRAHLFRRYLSLLGGRQCVDEAFVAAKHSTGAYRLAKDEALAFEMCVGASRSLVCRVRTLFCNACEKVARYIPFGLI